MVLEMSTGMQIFPYNNNMSTGVGRWSMMANFSQRSYRMAQKGLRVDPNHSFRETCENLV